MSRYVPLCKITPFLNTFLLSQVVSPTSKDTGQKLLKRVLKTCSQAVGESKAPQCVKFSSNFPEGVNKIINNKKNISSMS